MHTPGRIAADLASAAALRLTGELGTETMASAKKAKTTMRDQLLEAAWHLATGNVPVQVAAGWLVRSKSTQVGEIVSVKFEGVTIHREGTTLMIVMTGSDGVETILPITTDVRLEFYSQSGKTYIVRKDNLHCDCKGGEIEGKTCWHMVAVEFYQEALLHAERQRIAIGALARERQQHLRRLPRSYRSDRRYSPAGEYLLRPTPFHHSERERL